MRLTHTAGRAGRLSSFLREEMGMSAGLVNRLKWQDKLFVNGISRHTDYPVQPGDVISVPLDEDAPLYPAESGPITILYEDAHLLAVDKPAGMLVHPSRCQNSGTLANFVAGYYRDSGQPSAFHPVTRLDRDTFGVVLLAKNAHIHAAMNALQAEGRLEKTYRALVFGGPDAPSGVIDAPIARRPLPSLLREVRPEGKRAVTEYALLRREAEYSLLSLRPVTGRTHQLRLHCAHMDFPILGDPQYCSEASAALSARYGLTGQQLAAVEIAFSHPVTGEFLRVASRMSPGLEK